jgi:hypothetical protein
MPSKGATRARRRQKKEAWAARPDTQSKLDFPDLGGKYESPPEPEEKPSHLISQHIAEIISDKQRQNEMDRYRQQNKDLRNRVDNLTKQLKEFQKLVDEKSYKKMIELLKQKETKIQVSREQLQASSEQLQLGERTLEIRTQIIDRKTGEVDDAVSTVIGIKTTISELISLQINMKRNRDTFVADREIYSAMINQIEEMCQNKMKAQEEDHRQQIAKQETTHCDRLNKLKAEDKANRIQMKQQLQKRINMNIEYIRAVESKLYDNDVPSEYECPVCMEDVPLDKSITCGECNADICNTCFVSHIGSLLEKPIGEVTCAICLTAAIPIRVLPFHVPDDVFQRTLDSIMDYRSQEVARVEVEMERQRLTKMSKIDDYVEQVVETLTLRCPNPKCKTVVYDWSGCCAVCCDKCMNCFCGCCLDFYGNSDDTHIHVVECTPHSDVFSSDDRLKQFHSKLKASRVKKLLKTLDEDTLRVVIEKCLEKDLFKGNIGDEDMAIFGEFLDISPEPELDIRMNFPPIIQQLLDNGEIDLHHAFDMMID